MDYVCFDTSIVIWAVERAARPEEQSMIDRAARYLAFLDQQRTQVMIPTPVISEYLIRAHDPIAELKRLETGFFLPALDVPSAVLAAQIQNDAALLRQIRASAKVTKQELRVDAFILAIAKIHGALKVISNDPHMRKLAKGIIDVEELPDIKEQLSMFT